MSSYTMTLKEVLDFLTLNEDGSTRDRIENGRTKLFDFDYPIFDPDYKKVFETHFIRKFYMREIGFETEGLFKFQLETWLLINMSYFNKLFQSELLQFDVFKNTKMDVTNTKTAERSQSQTGSADATSTNTSSQDTTQDSDSTVNQDNFNRQLESNTPDNRLTITTNDGQGVIEYASSIEENNENNSQTSTANSTASTDSTSKDTNTANSTVDSEINETEDYIESRVGKVGNDSYSKMLQEYRDTFLRIENKIFSEMQELFMMVF